jgi:hypothetical protein
VSGFGSTNIPWDGGVGIPPVHRGSVEEARKAAVTVCALAAGDVAAARVVLDALGLLDTLRGVS